VTGEHAQPLVVGAAVVAVLALAAELDADRVEPGGRRRLDASF
jgi:hypothetical protein